MINPLESIGHTAQESKMSQFSTEDVVPLFLRSIENYTLFEKPIVIKKTNLDTWLVLDNTVLQDNNFDSTTRYLHSSSEQPLIELVKVVPPNDIFFEDYGNLHFVDMDLTTATITEDYISGTDGDELVSTWITYDYKTYSKAIFGFGNLLDNPDEPFQEKLVFPLSFPISFSNPDFSIYVYTDTNPTWTLVKTNPYTGTFTRFKYKFVFNTNAKISLKDSTNKRRTVFVIRFE